MFIDNLCKILGHEWITEDGSGFIVCKRCRNFSHVSMNPRDRHCAEEHIKKTGHESTFNLCCLVKQDYICQICGRPLCEDHALQYEYDKESICLDCSKIVVKERLQWLKAHNVGA